MLEYVNIFRSHQSEITVAEYVTEAANKMAKEGWELVTVSCTPASLTWNKQNHMTIWFKREKK